MSLANELNGRPPVDVAVLRLPIKLSGCRRDRVSFACRVSLLVMEQDEQQQQVAASCK